MNDKGLAIVTGGSSGIGAEFARQLANAGFDLLLVSNQRELLEKAKEEISAKNTQVKCHIMCQDLAQDGAAEKVMAHARNISSDISVLINNAGIFSFRQITDHSPEQLDLYVHLHISCVTHLSALAAKHMEKRRRGFILNMSSMSCWMPMPGIGMYSATKSYIRVFSRALHYEMKDCGVNIMVACPGGLATDLFGLPPNLQRLGVRIGALATPEKFVRKALKRLFKGRKQYINGLFNRIAIAGVYLLPTKARMLIKSKILTRYGS